MGEITTEALTPGFLPAGFGNRSRIDGPGSLGFVGIADQVTLTFSRGRARSDRASPISVHATERPGLELSATEKRPGTAIDLGVPGAAAVYHDGWWTAPLAGSVTPRWDNSGTHSLTVHTATRTYGVRAPRDVPLDELVAIARSVLQR